MNNAMSGEPAFLELGVPTGKKAREFYGSLFGWTFTDMGKDNFWAQTPTVKTGVHANDEDRCFVIYFGVDDIEAAAARVRELGGEAPEVGPAHEGFGRFVECRDTQGVRFGLHERKG